MGQDEKTRPAAREKSLLRATLGDGDSGYSFHDEARVEVVRTTPTRPMRAVTLGVAQAEPARKAPAAEARDTLPPMPSVPPELEGALATVHDLERDGPLDFEARASSPPQAQPPKMPRTTGALWDALPSVIHEAKAENRAEDAKQGEAARTDSQPPREEAQQAYPEVEARPSLLDLGRVSTLESEAGALAKYERMVERGAWDQLVHELSAVPKRTPAMSLLLVVAKREARSSDEKQNVNLTRDAIEAFSDLLGVPETSPTALMLTKRLLRKNPWHRSQKASNKLAFWLMLLGLGMGGGVGWLVTKFFL